MGTVTNGKYYTFSLEDLINSLLISEVPDILPTDIVEIKLSDQSLKFDIVVRNDDPVEL